MFLLVIKKGEIFMSEINKIGGVQPDQGNSPKKVEEKKGSETENKSVFEKAKETQIAGLVKSRIISPDGTVGPWCG